MSRSRGKAARARKRNPRNQPRGNQREARLRGVILRYWTAALRENNEAQDRHEDPKTKGPPPRPRVLGFFKDLNPWPFSNHALIRTTYKGVTYLSAEHAYLAEQARCYGLHGLAVAWTQGKGGITERGTRYDWSNPKRVKAYSTIAFKPFKDPRRKERQAWLAKRNNIMFQIVLAKFRGNKLARDALFKTGNQYLVEASPTDAHWGIGVKPQPTPAQLANNGPLSRSWGRNQLGLILMGVRNNLRTRIKQLKVITDRARRYLVTKAQRNLQKDPIAPGSEWMLSHFGRKFLPGVPRKANPKRLLYIGSTVEKRAFHLHHRNGRKVSDGVPHLKEAQPSC